MSAPLQQHAHGIDIITTAMGAPETLKPYTNLQEELVDFARLNRKGCLG
jgi:hypothetical protein